MSTEVKVPCRWYEPRPGCSGETEGYLVLRLGERRGEPVLTLTTTADNGMTTGPLSERLTVEVDDLPLVSAMLRAVQRRRRRQ